MLSAVTHCVYFRAEVTCLCVIPAYRRLTSELNTLCEKISIHHLHIRLLSVPSKHICNNGRDLSQLIGFHFHYNTTFIYHYNLMKRPSVWSFYQPLLTITCRYPPLPAILPAITHHYPPLPAITCRYPPLHVITHRYPPLPTIAAVTRHYPPLPAVTHHYPPLPTFTLRYPPLPAVTHHYPPLPVCNNSLGCRRKMRWQISFILVQIWFSFVGNCFTLVYIFYLKNVRFPEWHN